MYFGKDGKPFLLKFKDSLINKLKEKIDKDNVQENVITKKSILKEVTEFNDIYSTMWDKMLNTVCMKYTKDRNKAEDFCQNGFIKVYKNLHKYDDSGSLEGWVRRVINNNILDELRKKKMDFVDGEDGFDFSRLDVGEEPYEEEGLSMSDVRKVLPQLSPAYRKAFELYYLDGLKHDEIAKKLSISPNTSKTNLMKAKRKVRDLLKKTLLRGFFYFTTTFTSPFKRPTLIVSPFLIPSSNIFSAIGSSTYLCIALFRGLAPYFSS